MRALSPAVLMIFHTLIRESGPPWALRKTWSLESGRARWGAALAQVTSERTSVFGRDGHDALVPAADLDEAPCQQQGGLLQRGQFGDADASGVEHGEDGPVALAQRLVRVGRGEQGGDFLDREHVGQAALQFGRVEEFGWVVRRCSLEQ